MTQRSLSWHFWRGREKHLARLELTFPATSHWAVARIYRWELEDEDIPGGATPVVMSGWNANAPPGTYRNPEMSRQLLRDCGLTG